MNKQDFKRFLNGYKSFHENDFCAIHDCHDPRLVNKIENTGLRVSFNFDHPKKPGAFRTTMVEIKKDNDVYLGEPVAPMVIRIPENLMKLNPNSKNYREVHHAFSGYGREQMIDPSNPRDLDIVPVKTSEEANVRVLPNFYIEGHINENGEFIENPLAYKNLPPEQQSRIEKEVAEGRADMLCDSTAYKDPPKIESVPKQELETAMKEVRPSEPEIDTTYKKEKAKQTEISQDKN